ncbi:C39 family peptidase [Pontibacillus salipaludis]|uniref:Peptidase C39-like domain-containing protein n=1 Tax=Pontibacillus salipaludis TaxID=1697394 RepID=A0ABQ1QBX6_9BACI|nr:C39 family peptidase [Pontibacillus salipaludis]GGD22499.1 hypothetical protein GCM10011389_32810 [Pontibacillus salipaludis]
MKILYSGITILMIVAVMFVFQNHKTTKAKEVVVYQASSHSSKPTISSSPLTPKLESKVLVDAPHIQQLPELPRGCEMTSLAMLLQYADVDVDKMKLAEEIPKVPYIANGVNGNPNDGFVGDMYDYSNPGLSVFAEPVVNLAETYLPGEIHNLTGGSFYQIQMALDNQKPVWVIVASTFGDIDPEHWETWITNEGELRITNKIHSVLITGYDEDHVYINDPLYEEKDRKLPLSDFVAAWDTFGRQAITLN